MKKRTVWARMMERWKKAAGESNDDRRRYLCADWAIDFGDQLISTVRGLQDEVDGIIADLAREKAAHAETRAKATWYHRRAQQAEAWVTKTHAQIIDTGPANVGRGFANVAASAWKARAERAEAEVAALQADIETAAGHCMVTPPAPGTDAAKLLQANRLLALVVAHVVTRGPTSLDAVDALIDRLAHEMGRPPAVAEDLTRATKSLMGERATVAAAAADALNEGKT